MVVEPLVRQAWAEEDARMTFTIREYSPGDADAAVALWTEAGLVRPWNDPHHDIARAYDTWPKHFLVAVDESDHVIGTVLSGFDGHRGWLYYLAVAPLAQGSGIGKALVQEAEERLKSLGCVKIQLMVRSSNTDVLRFYESLGYEISDAVVTGKRLDS
ncbi:GNAT family acetyltransferase [Timonella sp. A28]|uniref:GNAT family acetyltransferase n=1 Tax=Timonella sp. A28 TaxID=3442640 RepID=UPI003EBDBC4C